MEGGDWALIGVVLINAMFFLLLFETIRIAGPVFFSVQNYIATLSGIGWGMLIHGEAHSLMDMAGAGAAICRPRPGYFRQPQGRCRAVASRFYYSYNFIKSGRSKGSAP